VVDVLTPLRKTLVQKVVVSVVAGYTYNRYEELLEPATHHLSTIPNTPVAVCEGVVVCEQQHSLSDAEYLNISALLACVGLVLPVETEQLAIAGTICGCGPAFACLFIEALADAAVKHGIARAEAYRMVSQMVVGTGKMQLTTGLHPGVMKDAVCSPGGTTIVGVTELESKGLRAAVIAAVDAIQRGRE
ncbi:MAG: pyrroline-5-carboxylate reductase dimerization domain-containing protein, partial [Alistipes sp.]